MINRSMLLKIAVTGLVILMGWAVASGVGARVDGIALLVPLLICVGMHIFGHGGHRHGGAGREDGP